jgi:Caspase domain
MQFPGLIAVAWLIFAGLPLMFAPAPAHAEKRVALVVGNASYRNADRLANPINDARGMRDALARLGFEVVYGEDLDQQNLRDRIGRFAEAVKDADTALVYFAGHGATFSDTPYVVPVDASFSSLERVPYELVAVETLIGELRRARGVRIAILDACRDNAAERDLKRTAAAGRGGEMTRGLGPMKNPEGLILAYATQYLSTAADDVGAGPQGASSPAGSRHSPFTAALLSNITTPGVDVKEMFYKVGRDVIAATGGKQRPEISISMYDQYALAPGGASSPPADELAWSFLKDTGNAEPIRRFIVQFPASPRRREAEERLRALEQANVAVTPAKPGGAAQSPPPPSGAGAAPAGAQQAAVVVPPVTPAVPPLAALTPVKATQILDDAAVRRLKGNKGVALHWISWDYLGRLKVTESNGVIHLDGSQSERNGAGRLVVSGDVVSIDQASFTFKGAISIYDSPHDSEDRKECLRNGVFNFRITGSRKYWRLQEMEACGGLTDYVDIFF